MPVSTTKEYFQEHREWSARKHAVLIEYLPAFFKALSKLSQERNAPMWYVDGYAGAGSYRDEKRGVESLGSPILAAEQIGKLREQYSYNIRCLNTELKPDYFQQLQQATQSFNYVENLQGDFRKCLSSVLKRVEGCSTLFFLDPFGTKMLPMRGLIELIAQRTSPTDMLIRYDTLGVKRLVGASQYAEKNGTSNPYSVILDHWFAGKGWQEIVQKEMGVEERDKQLLAYYRQQLLRISSTHRYCAVADYPIRTLANEHKYSMIFYTRDKLGVKLMNDTLFKVESDFVSHQKSFREAQQVTMSLFTLEPTPDEQKQAIIQGIKQYVQKQVVFKTDWQFGEMLFKLFSDDWFGRFKEAHLRDACKELVQSGNIQRLSEGNAWKPETAFRILPS
jgi:three-Cys-motif partner protein